MPEKSEDKPSGDLPSMVNPVADLAMKVTNIQRIGNVTENEVGRSNRSDRLQVIDIRLFIKYSK